MTTNVTTPTTGPSGRTGPTGSAGPTGPTDHRNEQGNAQGNEYEDGQRGGRGGKDTAAEAVAVIGLGAMGSALAEAFLHAGHRVTVWNRTAARAEAIAARGAVPAPTAREAVRSVGDGGLVIVCVVNDEAARQTLGTLGEDLAGRTVVNLTNSTPEQARSLASWMAEGGAAYLDGGIMAVPPMIGQPGALVLYSGDAAAFAAHRATLERLGAADFVGADPGAASALDLALLTAMYGLFGGFLQALAMVGAAPWAGAGTLSEFTMARVLPWLNGMMTGLPEMARQLDAGETVAAQSPLAMQAAAFDNLTDTCRALGVSPELIAPMGELLKRAVERGLGDGDLPSLVGLLREGTDR
ncbi:NAD(P)-binding domain-containing protein [Streptomyces sp. 4N509B]|uniref:NAD(P)-binding domain-containing protein n=1 Tax=Streptomyces sp. 4N509B TaxID=3457413 RepID=UPI003FD1F0C1